MHHRIGNVQKSNVCWPKFVKNMIHGSTDDQNLLELRYLMDKKDIATDLICHYCVRRAEIWEMAAALESNLLFFVNNIAISCSFNRWRVFILLEFLVW